MLEINERRTKRVSFQEQSKTMVGPSAHTRPTDRREITSLSPPNDRFAAWRTASCSGDDGAPSAVSAADSPAYTASPSDNPSTFRGARPLAKRELREIREKTDAISEDDGGFTDVELSPVAEGALSRFSEYGSVLSIGEVFLF